mgnify:CR=1 FL=1
MPYIGNTAADRFVASKAASVYSGDGSTTAFTLEHSVGADEDILVSVDGVVQEPSVAYAVSSGTTLTFTAAPSSNSGNNIFVYYLFRTVATVDHPATSALTATSGTFSTDLTVDTTTLVVDSTNNRVGIGTASPTQLLQVESSTNSAEVQLRLRGLTSGGGGRSAVVGFDPSSTTSSENHTFIGDGSSKFLKVDNVGHVTKPLQPAFQATLNGHQSNIAVGSAVTVLFATEIFDQNADFDTSTYTFTAPVAGRYQFNVQIMLATLDSANAYYQTQLITSNRTHYHTFDPDYGQDNSYDNATIATLTDMDANDTAIVKILQASGTQQTDLDNISSFSGYLAC